MLGECEMSFRFEMRREPMFRVPAAVSWLIGFMIVVHVVRSLLPADLSEDIMIRLSFMPIRYAPGIDGGSLIDKIVPFIGHQFLHASFFHLGMNCLWLLACGPVVARRYGMLAFWGFFLLCGIAGAGLFLAADWGGIDGMIGASGAVSGLMAASIRMIPGQLLALTMPGAVQGAEAPLASVRSKPVVAFALVWFVTNLIFGLTGIGAGGAGVHQIAWQAHIGGFIAGLLLPDVFDVVWRHFHRVQILP